MRLYLAPIAIAGVGAALFFGSGTEIKNSLPGVPRETSRSTMTAAELKVFKAAQLTAHKAAISSNPTGVERAAKRTAAFDQPYQFFHDRLTRLNECLDSRTCAYPQKDTRSYDLAVHNETRRTLSTLKKWQARHNYKDERITDLMVGYLTFEHVGVKSEALAILATQPPDPDALDPILEYVIEQPQPEVIAAGMRELRRYYHNRSERKRIDDSFEHVLKEGAVFAAIEVAKNLRPFLNKENTPRFKRVRQYLTTTQLADDVIEALDSHF